MPSGMARLTTRARARRSGVLSGLGIPLDTSPMEARLVDDLPDEPGWQFEPKWDGFRCLAFKADESVDLRAKSGKSLTRYFPEIVHAMGEVPVRQFVVDGELAIPRENSLSFDALQLRLHPAASRVRKLAAETPAIFVLFDCLLGESNESLLDAPLSRRRAELEKLFGIIGADRTFRLSPYTRKVSEARKWLRALHGSIDGVVAKRADRPYVPGEREMLKIKCLRTADCAVGGFRYAQGTRAVGSMLLGLYNNEGKLDHVGFTSTIAHAERAALTRKLE